MATIAHRSLLEIVKSYDFDGLTEFIVSRHELIIADSDVIEVLAYLGSGFVEACHGEHYLDCRLRRKLRVMGYFQRMFGEPKRVLKTGTQGIGNVGSGDKELPTEWISGSAGSWERSGEPRLMEVSNLSSQPLQTRNHRHRPAEMPGRSTRPHHDYRRGVSRAWPKSSARDYCTSRDSGSSRRNSGRDRREGEAGCMTLDLLTTEDLAVLAQQDMPTLATWWGVLNYWRWPDELPDAEMAHVYVPNCRRSQLMRWIEDAVGMRMCFRYSQPWKDKSEEEFNDFWRGAFEGHAPSRERHDRRVMDEIRRHEIDQQ